ncbi:tRNA pseudouridine(38-40) synthase TruA [Kaarinaea lacus]
MRLALGIEYDGSGFNGWQIQDNGIGIQHHVEQALCKVADHPVRVICAGRTDTGVHALNQVVHFDSDAERSQRSWVFGCNANLPKSVAVVWAKSVPEAFHARFSALRRRYRYVIFNRHVRPTFLAHRVTWEFRPLDVERMAEAACNLLGEHDFSAYRASECQAKSPVRTIYSLEVRRNDDLVFIDVEANAFLHHMVRNIAGVLMAIGAGEKSPDWSQQVLESRDRAIGGVTAPPFGLYLVDVEYGPEFDLPRVSHTQMIW